MFNQIFKRRRVLVRLKNNPISLHLESFTGYLLVRGHKVSTVQAYVLAVEHFGRWHGPRLSRSHSQMLSKINTFFGSHFVQCKCQMPVARSLIEARAALFHFVKILSKDSMLVRDNAKRGVTDTLIEEFQSHLRNNGGLAESTCRQRGRIAKEFILAQFKNRACRWSTVKPQDILHFVSKYGAKCRPGTVHVVAGSLRSFLKFLQLNGHCRQNLVNAVPRITLWSLSQIPKTMTDEQISQFIQSFDKSTPIGKRDFGMALLQLELGLRVSEVAALELDDVNWRQSVIRIRGGKSGRIRELLLSKKVGTVLANYLRRGRPVTSCRSFFVRHTVPHGTPAPVTLIRGVMRRHYARVDGSKKWTGTHLLRHTAATRMHCSGASLKEVGDILGHLSVDTTAIYTKVNFPKLLTVALDWPQVRP